MTNSPIHAKSVVTMGVQLSDLAEARSFYVDVVGPEERWELND